MIASSYQAPNLLWRLQNGELPNQLYPPVFWILIGTNDLANNKCSAERVVVGILRIVEELRSRRPASAIVINGLLPRSFNSEGYVAKGGRLTPSLWEHINAINEELKLYANYRDRVFYFETSVFFEDNSVPKSQLKINKDLMPDFLHPSPKGYQLWGAEIVHMLREIVPSNHKK